MFGQFSTDIEYIKTLLQENRLQEALIKCKEAFKAGGVNNSELWFLYGKILWALDKRAEATNAFNQSVELDPESPARFALEFSDDIASFFNPDLMNP